MGLDQYLYKVQREEICYWRKNNQLQGWFEKYCNQQNCIPTNLNKDNIELLDQLLVDLSAKALPITEGFFYGKEGMTSEEYDELIELFTEVRKDIIENDATYEYDCWY